MTLVLIPTALITMMLAHTSAVISLDMVRLHIRMEEKTGQLIAINTPTAVQHAHHLVLQQVRTAISTLTLAQQLGLMALRITRTVTSTLTAALQLAAMGTAVTPIAINTPTVVLPMVRAAIVRTIGECILSFHCFFPGLQGGRYFDYSRH